MVPLTSLLPQVNLKARGVPEPIAIFALRDAAIDFCRKSGILTEVLPPITIVPGTAEYQYQLLSTSRSMQGLRVSEAWINDSEVFPITPSDLAAENGNWSTLSGTPTNYIQPEEGSLRLFRIPNAAGTLTVRAVVAPRYDATEISDVLGYQWWQAVVSGALAYLMSVPGEPFSNPEGAAANGAAFAKFIDEAALAAYKGNTKARVRIRSHNF